MPRNSRSGEAPRRFILGAFLIFAADAVLALRLPSHGLIKQHGSERDAADDVFREVLSAQSTLHTGLLKARAGDLFASLAANQPLGDVELASGAQLRDPGLATVFSAQAAERLPRLAHGPSVSLSAPHLGSHLAATDSWALASGHGSDHGDPEERQQRAAGQERQQRNEQQQQRRSAAGIGAADPPPPEFNVDEAFVAGRLASIAYCSQSHLLEAWNCSRCGAVPGFAPHRVVYDAVWDLTAFAGYHAPLGAVVLSFRGTDSSNWGQWAENMRAWRTDHMYPVPDFPHALIHAGFYTLWTGSTLQASFTGAVSELMAAHPTARLLAVGHSMGGALAQLAALEFKLFYNQTRATVYTFGAPRVGNLAYQQLFNSFIDVSWRFTHNRDIVPSVPLQLMGFQHVAREVWEVDVEDPSAASSGGVERKLLLCDGTGEDPSCHNSACYLGLCTSIADHLVYLGLHMYQDSVEC
ncbi:hypothetical protein PLESTB_000827800 [Pleodorina starrii]|uniref:Fungal lipase-type domain-containing protein n=1 Tax=Pleodorina starrii TaxID=330485 RepID=A0A9W6F3B8_9CHLO|nr:hypothetical protein PLESTB_000827800 [Pleodorina starrii]GLC64560.1 hypothetical protein PLESTF_000178800 [Pleodorina starrii]